MPSEAYERGHRSMALFPLLPQGRHCPTVHRMSRHPPGRQSTTLCSTASSHRSRSNRWPRSRNSKSCIDVENLEACLDCRLSPRLWTRAPRKRLEDPTRIAPMLHSPDSPLPTPESDPSRAPVATGSRSSPRSTSQQSCPRTPDPQDALSRRACQLA